MSKRRASRRRARSSVASWGACCAVEALERRALLTTLYVDASAPGPTFDGTTWNTAYRDLQLALAQAVPGQTIKVAAGTYKPTADANRVASLHLLRGVALFGGYAGVDHSDPDERNVDQHQTILSGDLGVQDDNIDNSYHVLIANGTDSTTIFDGFTVSGGNASDLSGASDRYGGGIFIANGSPLITNCRITGNSAASLGGGMYVRDSAAVLSDCSFEANAGSTGGALAIASSSLTITNCSFTANSAVSSGGAIGEGGNSFISGCTFTANTSMTAGAMTIGGSPTISNCTFIGNNAIGAFAGSAVRNQGSPTFVDCLFEANQHTGASSDGGTVFNDGNGGGTFIRCRFVRNNGHGMYSYGPEPITVIDCRFEGNTGGGFVEGFQEQTTIINSLFVGNLGAGISSGVPSVVPSTTVVNCVLVGNATGFASAGPSSTLSNCIIWGNGSSSADQVFGTTTIMNSLIQGGYAGAGNIDADPQFVRNPSPGPDTIWGTADDDYGDLRLKLSSPGIDSGSNAAVPAGVTADLAGNSRFIDVPGVHDPDAVVDIGAYEYVVPLTAISGVYLFDASVPTVSITFNGDVDDSTVSTGDLVLLDPTSGLPVAGLPTPIVSYDSETRTAKWGFATGLPDGNYLGKIAVGAVSDLYGGGLSADLTFDFHILAADPNRDRRVDVHDLVIVANNWLQTGRTFSTGDFNYDGVVDKLDLGMMATRWHVQISQPLPPAPPVPVSAVRPATRTPTRTPTRVIEIVIAPRHQIV